MLKDEDGRPVTEMSNEEIAQILRKVSQGQALQVAFDQGVTGEASTFISCILTPRPCEPLEGAPSFMCSVQLSCGIKILPRVRSDNKKQFQDWILTKGWKGAPDIPWGRIVRVSIYEKAEAPILRMLPPRDPAGLCAC